MGDVTILTVPLNNNIGVNFFLSIFLPDLTLEIAYQYIYFKIVWIFLFFSQISYLRMDSFSDWTQFIAP